MLQIDTWKRVLIWLVCVTGLLLALPNAFYTRVEQSNDAKAAIELGLSSTELSEQAGQWPDWMPSRRSREDRRTPHKRQIWHR